VIKLSRINTILFDLDGTLVDSNELIIESFRETFKKYQPEKTYSRQELIDMIGPPLKESFKVVSEQEAVILEMIDFYRKFYQDNEFQYITLYPNVIETLAALSNKGINLGIVTTKFKESAMPSIKHFGIDKYIKHNSFLGDVEEHKPSPKPLYHVLKNFNNTDKVMMVGDNSSDILAGKNAKVYTCGLEWALNREKLLNTKPDFWIEDYLELLNIINKEI
jgi:pyrophosphatase PpaX